jgi:dual specificity MAP kinase phosphatase
MDNMQSFFSLINIEVQRIIDQLYRGVYGLPQAKRSMITPAIYLGGQYGLKRLSDMKRLGITGIVNMRMHSIHKEGKAEGFHLLQLPTPDRHAPSLKDLQTGVEFIKNEIDKGGKVYIHCHWGEGRGASMVIAYLLSTGLTYDDALGLVRKVRTFIRPTKPQVERLREFEYVSLRAKRGNLF